MSNDNNITITSLSGSGAAAGANAFIAGAIGTPTVTPEAHAAAVAIAQSLFDGPPVDSTKHLKSDISRFSRYFRIGMSVAGILTTGIILIMKVAAIAALVGIIANPIGLGIIGGCALIALSLAVFNLYRRHQALLEISRMPFGYSNTPWGVTLDEIPVGLFFPYTLYCLYRDWNVASKGLN